MIEKAMVLFPHPDSP
ncbi:hypothetical protein D043_1105A, partial [Vibrio parahaemolyticus EKP-021]